jgi:4-amino-4-deoxy-L-arabinose transferase-like glycosyltransferase
VRVEEKDSRALTCASVSRIERIAVLAAICLLAFVLRAYRLDGQSLWSDEDITLDRAGQALGEMLAGLPVEQAPGYYVLMRGWTRLAGESDLALRFPSLLAGVLAVALAAYMGTRLVNRDTGLLLALIVAVNPFLVYYGQEARMYALLMALALACMAALLRARERAGERPEERATDRDTERAGTGAGAGWWVVLGVLVAATLYTHYYGVLIVVGLAGWAFFDLLAREGKWIRGWVMAALTATLIFGPWLPRALGVLEFSGWRSDLRLSGAPMVHFGQWFAGLTAPANSPALWLYAIAALIALVYLLFLTLLEWRWPSFVDTEGRRLTGLRSNTALLLLPLLVYGLIVLRTADLEAGWRAATADFDPRYAMAALPGLYLLVASGLETLCGWVASFLAQAKQPREALGRLGPSLAAGLILLSAWPGLRNLYTDPAWQKQDYRAFVAAVEAAAGHEDTVLLLDGPNYGLARRYEVEDSPVKIVNLHSSGNMKRSPGERAAYIAELAESFPHLWLAEDGARMGEARSWLDANSYPVDEAGYQDITLRRYYRPVLASRDPACIGESAAGRPCAEMASSLADLEPDEGFSTSGDLDCAVRSLSRLAAGEMLTLALSCTANEAITGQLDISVRLFRVEAAEGVGSPGQALAESRSPAEPQPALVSDRRLVYESSSRAIVEPGQIISDRHALSLPASMAAGEYRIEVLIYEEVAMETLSKRFGRVAVEPAR